MPRDGRGRVAAAHRGCRRGGARLTAGFAVAVRVIMGGTLHTRGVMIPLLIGSESGFGIEKRLKN